MLTKKGIGRPSSYNQEVVDQICEGLASGKSLHRLCQEEGMPSQPTVHRWLREHEEFRLQYAQAREVQRNMILEEIFEIADDASRDFKTVVKDGLEVRVFDYENLQRTKLWIDVRKWKLARMSPKKYGVMGLVGNHRSPGSRR